MKADSDLREQLKTQGLLLASNNKGKLKELRRLLEPVGIQVLTPGDLNLVLDVEETGTTFEANAGLKAGAGFELSGRPCLADDSGLCVDHLNGEPGVYSARFGGPGLNDRERCERLLEKMQSAIGHAARQAHFECVLALQSSQSDGTSPAKIWNFHGEVHGHIAPAMSGDQGFGYDPLFIPENYERSFAELAAEVKNTISHRARDLQKFLSFLEDR